MISKQLGFSSYVQSDSMSSSLDRQFDTRKKKSCKEKDKWRRATVNFIICTSKPIIYCARSATKKLCAAQCQGNVKRASHARGKKYIYTFAAWNAAIRGDCALILPTWREVAFVGAMYNKWNRANSLKLRLQRLRTNYEDLREECLVECLCTLRLGAKATWNIFMRRKLDKWWLMTIIEYAET